MEWKVAVAHSGEIRCRWIMNYLPALSEYTSGFECSDLATEMQPKEAPGAPGIEPKWTPSTKVGIGTSYHTGCRLWFTLSHGIINELYYPRIDTPNTRDVEFLITDGETFCHEERRDFSYEIEYPEQGTLLYRLINTALDQTYRLIKEIYTDPHTSVLIQHTKLEVLKPEREGKLKVYLLISPHLNKGGWGNSGRVGSLAGNRVLHAWKENTHLMAGSMPAFGKCSVGYVGSSDGWQDLRNFKMDWEYHQAMDGNICMCSEVFFDEKNEHRLAIALGTSPQSTGAKLMQSLGTPAAELRASYVKQWQRVSGDVDHKDHTGDWGSFYRLSRCILLAHEDKTFAGAMVASMSIPWGEIRSDNELGGYHLVWPRDLLQSCMALLSSGQIQTPRRALIWLACLQAPDGRMPQNSWIDGMPYWKGLQLDEVAAPILLAWKLYEMKGLGDFDPTPMVDRAVRFLVLNGPVTLQDRWEEATGISPSTLAVVIAALCAAAKMAENQNRVAYATWIQAYADWLNRHVEDWTVTVKGELCSDLPRHYIRITPMKGFDPEEEPRPNQSGYWSANGGGYHEARNVVSGDFLHLVRYGLRDPMDPVIRESLKVTDRILKRETLAGSCFRRYNTDGYGQKADGSSFDGTGVGGGWPLLTGERGHYELAAGNDPFPCIYAMEHFANDGGMLPEQVWWHDPIEGKFEQGDATGSAMPLCWAHAEYMCLVKSRSQGSPFDRVLPAYERYVQQQGVQQSIEMWTWSFRPSSLREGSTLRVILSQAFTVKCAEALFTSQVMESDLHFVDLLTSHLSVGETFEFRLYEEGESMSKHRIKVIKKGDFVLKSP